MSNPAKNSQQVPENEGVGKDGGTNEVISASPQKTGGGEQGAAFLTTKQQAYIAKSITSLYQPVFKRALKATAVQPASRPNALAAPT